MWEMRNRYLAVWALAAGVTACMAVAPMALP
jgi:hypothetical protein